MSDIAELGPLDVQPDPETWRWLHQLAAEQHGGSITVAVCALLKAARLAETSPAADPWAGLTALATNRSWPRYRVPVDALERFCDAWDSRLSRQEQLSAAEVIADLRAGLAR